MDSKKKTVLVACGTGIATSTVVAERVEQLIKNNKLNAQVVQCKIAEVASKEKEADLLVTTTILPKSFSIPVIKAMAYLTGVNTEKIDNEIIEFLKK
ncbi:PTS sugar transporter subunit IIB [Thermoanaerobacterium sp. R66]|uniref:PTS sugar transporter subunit IIB n=1 Tax=Thermoanaerobacterium sp. R66 TaxID=2742479 RepID=UPI002380C30C|nr:PTS sugar transporter subunit IIB [Thermoanaerobacterium sp. R66]MDE4542171.1 PTS sugar transporter subunit IIB [Thermoanaerobacterium sp. R66]